MVDVLWSPRDWAHAIAALPTTGPLPGRCVLVPREAVAHSLRRELVRDGLGGTLAGSRFLPTAAAAIEVLRTAGVEFRPGEGGLRPTRLRALFRAGLTLRHFSRALLRDKPGWDMAFARAIGDLEGAGLEPEDLETAAATDATRDIAAIWRAVDEAAGTSWTLARIHRRAARLLEREPAAWPFPRPVLAATSLGITSVVGHFLRVIPEVRLAVLDGRPVRARHLERAAALLGRQAAATVAAAGPVRTGASERDLLASYLFESPAILADPARPRSEGPDGTVELEEHAGIESELEATVDWVARQVAAATPLEEIAVLVPALDPFAGLLADRLARLPWADGPMPVHVAGGLPLTDTAAGARALAVVRGLCAHLAAASLAEVLPALRPATETDRRLSSGAALDLAWSLGTVGGNPAWPEGALDWARRAAEREGEIETQLARAGVEEDDPEAPGIARRAWELERLLRDLRAVRPALEALVGVARLAVARAPLADLWPALREFLARWLLQPGTGARVHALLDGALRPLVEDPAGATVSGSDGLALIEETLARLRRGVGRFGEPAVYVGTVREAAGLAFAAVRVVGLGEGHLPSTPHEDPVLPDAARLALERAHPGRGVLLPTTADRVLEELHALDAAVRGARRHVALSVPRIDIERSQREPSSVMLEAATALARPDRLTGGRGPLVPDGRTLRRDFFVPSRLAALAFRRSMPLTEAAWQDAVAAGQVSPPARWLASPAIDLARIAALQAGPEPATMDGWLALPGLRMPGLEADRPISPSALEVLLGCPHRFLLERVLRLREPAAPPALREIGQPAYGGLFHQVAELFYRRHGAAFCRGDGGLADWLARLDPIVDATFAAFLGQYPLVGATVREHERDRLRRDLRELLERDWPGSRRRRFVDVERPFGRPAPVPLRLGERTLYLRGRIDRLDVVDGVTVVRDLKTGRPYPRQGREFDPQPALDLQIGVYGLVVKAQAAAWGVPTRVAAAYAYFGRRGADVREFDEDFEAALEPAARDWLDLAAGLLSARVFPRTPAPADCVYCAFRPVCGEGVYERAAALLAAGAEPVRRFAALKGVGLAGEDAE